jgi:CRP-like cAMP-binding protein
VAATVNVKAGKFLFKEGDEGGGLYIIRRGRVQVFRERNDLEVQFAELGPGDVLGTMTLLTGEPRTASVRALEDVEAIVMDSTAFTAGLGELPKWTTVVIKDLTARLKSGNEKLVEASLRDRRLREQTSNLFHHLGQFACYLAFVIQHASKVDSDFGEVTPIDDVIARAEPILNLRTEYLAQIWTVIRESGMVSLDKSWQYGTVLRSPKPALFLALGEYAFQFARREPNKPAAKSKSAEVNRQRELFERICRTLLETPVEATAADRAYL